MGNPLEHAEFSASGSYRWLNCPGSHELIKRAPPKPDSRYSLEGTEAHECLEFLLKNRGALDRAVKSALRKYPDEMVEHAKNLVDWVLFTAEPGDTILSETKVDASSFTCSSQFGTLDIAIVREFGRLTVIDYKYGAGVAVEPDGHDGKGNPQLVYYGLGISEKYDHNFSEVELVVAQPRAWHESGETLRSHVLPMEEFLEWRERFRLGVMATSDPEAPLATGAWCKFCPAAIICPETKEKAMREAQVVFDDEKGVVELPELAVVKLPNLGTILSGCDRLEAFIKAVREHAAHVMEKGGEIPGWKLVQKRSTRKWKDLDTAADEARVAFGKKAFSEPKLLSPAQLEKAAKGAKGLDKWVAERVTNESSGTTLVDDSDKRPAVRPLENVFPEIKGLVSDR